MKTLKNKGVVAFINPEAQLGKNVKVWHFAYIGKGTKIGENTVVGSLSHIDQDVIIGRNCRIQGKVYISRSVVIGNNVFLGPACVLLNDKYPPSGVCRAPIIEDDVIIGGNATIMPDIRIGKGAVVGAGSLVAKNVNTQVVVCGNPAKFLMSQREYLEKQKAWITKSH